MEWLAASQLHFKLTIIIWTSTYFPPPKWKGQTTTSTLFISTKLMQHLENRVQSKNLARREKSPYYLLFILLSFTPKPTITQTESPKCRKEAHDHHWGACKIYFSMGNRNYSRLPNPSSTWSLGRFLYPSVSFTQRQYFVWNTPIRQ